MGFLLVQQSFSNDALFLKYLKCSEENAAILLRVLADLKICESSDLKTKLRALYKLVEPFDVDSENMQYPGCEES